MLRCTPQGTLCYSVHLSEPSCYSVQTVSERDGDWFTNMAQFHIWFLLSLSLKSQQVQIRNLLPITASLLLYFTKYKHIWHAAVCCVEFMSVNTMSTSSKVNCTVMCATADNVIDQWRGGWGVGEEQTEVCGQKGSSAGAVSQKISKTVVAKIRFPLFI